MPPFILEALSSECMSAASAKVRSPPRITAASESRTVVVSRSSSSV
jgi:hypothetical protein